MADNVLGNMWEGFMDLPGPAKALIVVGAGGAGYLAYRHAKNSPTSATQANGTSQLPITQGDTSQVASGGPSTGYPGGFWQSIAGPAGPPGPAGPAGPPGPSGLYSPPAGGGTGSGTGPVPILTASAVPMGGAGGFGQNVLAPLKPGFGPHPPVPFKRS